MASRLEKLPLELRQNIISQLGTPGRCVADLLSLSLVSKALHLATARSLYQTFEAGAHCKPVRRYLRTLCTNSTLCEDVRHVTLWPSDLNPFTAPTSFDFALFAAAIKKGIKAEHLQKCALSCLKLGCHNAEVLAILCLTTNITRLDFFFADMRSLEYGNVDKRAHACKCSGADLKRCILAIISSGSHDRIQACAYYSPVESSDRSHVLLEVFSASLGLKSPRSLSCTGLKLPSTYRVRDGSETWNVRVLRLISCDIGASSVSIILNHCKRLEEFCLELARPERSFWDIDLATLLRALYRHRHSLRTLKLSDVTGNGDALRGQAAIDDLLDLSALETLKIDEVLLTGGLGWQHVDLKSILPWWISQLKIYSHGELTEIGTILTAFNGWKPVRFVSLDVKFRIRAGINSLYAKAWDYGSHTKADFSGTFFLVDYKDPREDEEPYCLRFRCTETEVCDGFVKFGRKLNEGLAYFTDLAEVGDTVSLWEGGPIRDADRMFIDETFWVDDDR